jgi:4-amino-4-deoxy-L-arabinose transferase-like glycosyltransferase
MSASAPSRAPALRRPSFEVGLNWRIAAGFARAPIWPALAIAVLAAWLRVVSLDGTRTNPYYDAAVRTMSLSLHNFLYGVFTPGGQLAIDKPPVDLWFQVASVKLFGFSPESLILPQALAASIACALLFDLVRRAFGTGAGVAAGVALAVLPISVVTSRSDTMDSLMMALMVLAAWLVVRAAQTGRARWLYLAAIVMGIDFEVKLFEALVVLPALGLLFWIAMPERRVRRLEQSALAIVVFVAVALSWPVFVSLTPAASRPFPIGSTNGSVWNSIFVFNGVDRISPAKPQPLAPIHARSHGRHRRRHHRLAALHRFHRPDARRAPSGVARFLENRGGNYGARVGVELVAALLFGVLAAMASLAFGLRRPPPPAGARLGIALAVAVAAWIVPGIVLWSSVQQLHARYLESVTPAIAAAAGIGIAALVRLASLRVAGTVLLAGALAGSAAFAVHRAALGGLTTLVVLASVAAVALAAAAGRGRSLRMLGPVACALAIAAVLAAPLHTSLAVVRNHASDSGFPGALPQSTVDRLSAYLRRHQHHARYELAVSSWASAGQIVVHDARPVLALTSVARKPLVTIRELRSLVKAHELRYVLITGHCGTTPPSHLPRCPATVAWVRRHAVDVTHRAGIREKGLLWRLRGRAAAERRTARRRHRRRRATRAHRRTARGGSHGTPAHRGRRRSA